MKFKSQKETVKDSKITAAKLTTFQTMRTSTIANKPDVQQMYTHKKSSVNTVLI